MKSLKDVLNGFSWDPEMRNKAEGTVVKYLCRGAPDNCASFPLNKIISCHHGWVEFASELGTTTIPTHRILTVQNGMFI